MSLMKTASPLIPSPRTAGMVIVVIEEERGEREVTDQIRWRREEKCYESMMPSEAKMSKAATPPLGA